MNILKLTSLFTTRYDPLQAIFVAVCIALLFSSPVEAKKILILGPEGPFTHANGTPPVLQDFLQANGHTLHESHTSSSPYHAGPDQTVDVVILHRTFGIISESAVKEWVLNGGLLITDGEDSEWALNSAKLLEADDVGQARVSGGAQVRFEMPGVGIAKGVNSPYIDPPIQAPGQAAGVPWEGTGRTEIFRNFAAIGNQVQILARREGGEPAIFAGKSGKGTTLVIGYLWGNKWNLANGDTKRLILNAIDYGDTHLEAVENEITRSESFRSATGIWADYDGDGDPDLFIPRSGEPDQLFKNQIDDFIEVGALSGVANSQVCLGAAWGDFDNDGWPDLYVSVENHPNNSLDPTDRFYKNNQDGTFIEIGGQVGLAQTGNSRLPVWGDYDNDGDLDLYVNDNTLVNRLFRNDKANSFVDVANFIGVGGPANTGGASAWVDLDDDGDLDLHVTLWDVPDLFFKGAALILRKRIAERAPNPDHILS